MESKGSTERKFNEKLLQVLPKLNNIDGNVKDTSRLEVLSLVTQVWNAYFIHLLFPRLRFSLDVGCKIQNRNIVSDKDMLLSDLFCTKINSTLKHS